ncbi:hypothetical protein Tco_0685963 [Tanacetum coccineum]
MSDSGRFYVTYTEDNLAHMRTYLHWIQRADGLFSGFHRLQISAWPEEPEQAPPSPLYIPFVPELFTGVLPVDDEGIYRESDPEEDPEEDDKRIQPKYPADRGATGMMRSHFEMMMMQRKGSISPADPAAGAYSADQAHTLLVALRLGCPSDPRRRHLSSPRKLLRDYEIDWICLPLRTEACVIHPVLDTRIGESSAVDAESRELGYGITAIPRRMSFDEEEADYLVPAWAQSMDACDQVRSEGISLRTTVMAQQFEITELQAVDRRRQSVSSDLLKADYRRQRQLVEALKICERAPRSERSELQRQQGPVRILQNQSYQRRPVAVLRLGYGCSYCTKIAPRGRPTRLNPGTTPPPVTDPTTTTSVTSAQLQAMIDEGVTAVLAAIAPNMVELTLLGQMTNDVAYVMTWTDLEEELALLCDRMFPEETDKIERYVGGMPDLIYSSVVASKPKTMQEAIEMATELMDRRIDTFAERQADNKRKFEDTPRTNQNQQQNTLAGFCCRERPLQEGPAPSGRTELGNATCSQAYAVGVAGQNQTTRAKSEFFMEDGSRYKCRTRLNIILVHQDQKYSAYKVSRLCGTYYHQETGDKSKKKHYSSRALFDWPIRNERIGGSIQESSVQRARCLLKDEPKLGYHQLRVREETSRRRAFRTRFGHYEFHDDIVFYSKNIARARQLCDNIRVVEKRGVVCNFKCEFWIPKVQFLGHMIDNNGFMWISQARSVKDWASLRHQRRFDRSLVLLVIIDDSSKGLGAVLIAKAKKRKANVIADVERIRSGNHVKSSSFSHDYRLDFLRNLEWPQVLKHGIKKSRVRMLEVLLIEMLNSQRLLDRKVEPRIMVNIKVPPFAALYGRKCRSPVCWAEAKSYAVFKGVKQMEFEDGDNVMLKFVEEPIEITDREVKWLKRSRIPLVKVRWNSKRGPEFTWEREDQFRKKYPHLFSKTGPSSSAAS